MKWIDVDYDSPSDGDNLMIWMEEVNPEDHVLSYYKAGYYDPEVDRFYDENNESLENVTFYMIVKRPPRKYACQKCKTFYNEPGEAMLCCEGGNHETS